MERRLLLSIYIPRDKLGHRPVERLKELAEKRSRSVNQLVMTAILEYLDREEPLISSSGKPAGHVQKPSTSRRSSSHRRTDPSGRAHDARRQMLGELTSTRAIDEESEMLIRAAAREVAEKIQAGVESAEVLWQGPNVAHVVMSRVFLPELGVRVSLDEYRKLVLAELVTALEVLGWESQPQNRFVRRWFVEEWREDTARRRGVASSASDSLDAEATGNRGCTSGAAKPIVGLVGIAFGAYLFFSGLGGGNAEGGIVAGLAVIVVTAIYLAGAGKNRA